jgi:hypothetical protein
MPGHYHDKEPSNKLKNITLDDLTQTQVKSAAGVVYIDSPSALADTVAFHNAKLAVATFGSTVIPSKGAVGTVAFTDAPPTGSVLDIPEGEVWLTWPSLWRVVNGASATNDVKVYIQEVGGHSCQIGATTTVASAATDGAAITASVALPIPRSIRLTKNLTLAVVGTQSDESTLKIPYQLEAF